MDQSPQGFASEDEEATYCLSLLRDGDRHQKIVARERLSQIFEHRGMLDEAAQCLESNIREGVRDPRVYQRLAGVYRRQGRHELAEEVLLEARRLAERMARPQQPPGRRGPGGRPGRPGPAPGAVTPPGPGDVPTANLPAAPPPRAATVPSAGGELALDQGDTGLLPSPYDMQEQATTPTVAGRPWWLSPGMLILLILLCGPYGLALMWVRGGYAKQTKVRVASVWAGLMVLMLAGAAVALQPQLPTLLTLAARGAGAPAVPGVPTPRVFGPPPSQVGIPTGTLPPGLGLVPPSPIASPGVLATRPAGVTIAPPSAKPEDGDEDDEPGPAPTSAPTGPSAPGGPPAAAAKPSGEQVKVGDTGGTGANMRERPGAAGQIVKTVPEGAVLTVVGADQQMDGKAWRNVRDDTGTTGWIAEELLEPA